MQYERVRTDRREKDRPRSGFLVWLRWSRNVLIQTRVCMSDRSEPYSTGRRRGLSTCWCACVYKRERNLRVSNLPVLLGDVVLGIGIFVFGTAGITASCRGEGYLVMYFQFGAKIIRQRTHTDTLINSWETIWGITMLYVEWTFDWEKWISSINFEMSVVARRLANNVRLTWMKAEFQLFR